MNEHILNKALAMLAEMQDLQVQGLTQKVINLQKELNDEILKNKKGAADAAFVRPAGAPIHVLEPEIKPEVKSDVPVKDELG